MLHGYKQRYCLIKTEGIWEEISKVVEINYDI